MKSGWACPVLDVHGMDAFAHNTDSDPGEHDGAERERLPDEPECSRLPPLSLMERLDLELELARMLCPEQPPSVEDYYCY